MAYRVDRDYLYPDIREALKSDSQEEEKKPTRPVRGGAPARSPQPEANLNDPGEKQPKEELPVSTEPAVTRQPSPSARQATKKDIAANTSPAPATRGKGPVRRNMTDDMKDV